MSYISPIKIGHTVEPEEGWTDKIGRYMAGEVDNLIIESCVKVGCHVDKDELEKALRYDRGQYFKGYADGKRDAVVRCGECAHCYAEGFAHERNICEKHPELGNVPDDWFCADGEREVQDD